MDQLSFGSSVCRPLVCDADRTEGVGQVIRGLLEKLDRVRRHRGVVVSTPESIKSLVLKFLESQQTLTEQKTCACLCAVAPQRICSPREFLCVLAVTSAETDMSMACDVLARVVNLFREGTVWSI